MSQQGVNFTRQGDQAWVIGGKLVIATGGSIVPNSETQASAITDLTVTGTYATDDTPIETAINSILTALRDANIIAT